MPNHLCININSGSHTGDSSMKDVSRDAMKAWNSGLTIDDAVKKYGPQMKAEFQIIEQHYGCASIPVNVLYGYHKKERCTDPKYLEWKGDTGPGAMLKRIIAQQQNKNK